MSLFWLLQNNNNASVSFDRFCSVVRGRSGLTPDNAVSQIASILNVSAGSSAMYCLSRLLRSDSLLSDENLRPIYQQLYGDSSWTAATGGYANITNLAPLSVLASVFRLWRGRSVKGERRPTCARLRLRAVLPSGEAICPQKARRLCATDCQRSERRPRQLGDKKAEEDTERHARPVRRGTPPRIQHAWCRSRQRREQFQGRQVVCREIQKNERCRSYRLPRYDRD